MPVGGGKLVWTEEEDALLKLLVKKHGDTSWSAIAKDMRTKGSKQCRRRWKNVLTINAKCTSWTEDEDARLIQYHRELGNKWTEISKRFGDRTDNATKNRWHALCRKNPELVDSRGPISKVGVRKGTKTHSRIVGDSSASDPSVSMQQYPSNKCGGLPTPFDQKEASLSIMSPAEILKQQIDMMASGPLQQQQLSRLSQLSGLARAFEDMKRNPASNQIPSMECSDSFQKWLGSAVFNTLPWGSMQLPSQPLGTFGDLDNILGSSVSSDGASKTGLPNEKGFEPSKSASGQLFDVPMPFNGLQNSLSSNQQDLLATLLLQNSKSLDVDNQSRATKRKRQDDTGGPEGIDGQPSTSDLKFLLSNLSRHMDEPHNK